MPRVGLAARRRSSSEPRGASRAARSLESPWRSMRSRIASCISADSWTRASAETATARALSAGSPLLTSGQVKQRKGLLYRALGTRVKGRGQAIDDCTGIDPADLHQFLQDLEGECDRRGIAAAQEVEVPCAASGPFLRGWLEPIVDRPRTISRASRASRARARRETASSSRSREIFPRLRVPTRRPFPGRRGG